MPRKCTLPTRTKGPSPYSRPATRCRRTKSSRSASGGGAPLTPRSPVNCEVSEDGERVTFTLDNGAHYTISSTLSTPEHFWGTIYEAEWSHPESAQTCVCVVKASDFNLEETNCEDDRAEYRRPRRDFEREVSTFLSSSHRNIVNMYDYWEWNGRGYIAMKKMNGSLGDIVYDPTYRDLLDDLRSNEPILAELLRQVRPPPNFLLTQTNCPRFCQAWHICTIAISFIAT